MNTSLISERATIAGAALVAVGFIIAAWIGGNAFYQTRALSNVLSVTGSATATTTADSATWTLTVTRSATEGQLPTVQGTVASDVQQVVNFFSNAGIPASDIQVTPLSVDRDYSRDQNAPTTYNVHEDVTVQSKDPSLIDKLSKNTGSLLAKGILVSAQQPQYFISDLPQLRVALIGKAVTDAKARATEIAKSTGQEVGALQSASSGVVQVMSPNSIEISDYGSYDTSTIQKVVMVTARATFLVK
jgi:hypothetical protein